MRGCVSPNLRTFAAEMKTASTIFLLVVFSLVGRAQVVYDSVMTVTPLQTDTLLEQLEQVMTVAETLDSLQAVERQQDKEERHRDPFIKRALRYIGGSRVPKDKPFDFTLLFGPGYSKTNSLTLGGGFAGQYSYNRKDPTLKRSDLSAFFSASIKGMVMLYVKTDNYMRGDRIRWDARIKIQNAPGDFWGMGYTFGRTDSLESRYHYWRVQARPNFLFRVAKNFYAGPSLDLHWMKVHDGYNQLWRGEDANIFSNGIGVTIQYDSRDVPINAFKGYYAQFKQMFYPKLTNHSYHFNTSEVFLQGYWRTWKDCVLAAQIHSRSMYGGTAPWFMLSLVGDNGNMRGYYEGRYRDRDILEGQIEFRQHIYKHIGVTLFGGFANVFPDYKHIEMKHTLPNFGMGIRWELKPRMNICLDLGFTRDKPGVQFSMGETF